MLQPLTGMDTHTHQPPVPQTGSNLPVMVDTALQIAILGPSNEINCQARDTLLQAGHRVQIFENASELLDTDFCDNLDLTMLMGTDLKSLVDFAMAYGTPSLRVPFWTCFQEDRFHQMLLLKSIWDAMFIDKMDRRHYGKELKWWALPQQVKLAASTGHFVASEDQEIWH